MAREFSQEQHNYMVAKACFEVAREAYRKHDKLVDAECVKLGIEIPFGILPDGHDMREESQRLLDQENAAAAAMYAAAHALFDWATETILAKLGTAEQKAAVRGLVVSVKKMAFVEKPFIELVDCSMRLCAEVSGGG